MNTNDREQLKQLQLSIEDQEKKINRILQYLENDDSTSQMGVINKVEDVAKKLDGILTREKIYKAKATVWGMVGSILVAAAYTLGKFILSKAF